jgi:hypothetical protein
MKTSVENCEFTIIVEARGKMVLVVSTELPTAISLGKT